MFVLAVDDEPLALSIIETFVKRINYIQKFEAISSSVDALTYLNENEVDLIFLDINMPQLSGIELAKIIPQNTLMIFTTAYEQYALTGFDLSAVDYLVKPFSFERFYKAASRAHELYLLKSAKSQRGQVEDQLMIKVDYATVKIEINDILFVEGLKDYIKIYTKQKNYITKSTMKNIEERLVDDNFKRVHKSFIVNMAHMKAFENNQIIVDTHKIPLSSGYKDKFNEYLEKFKL